MQCTAFLPIAKSASPAPHDLVDAVFALEGRDDLLLVVRRVEALGKFLDTEDGKNLLAGYQRATNILRIEEKKDARAYVGAPDPQFYRQAEEWALAEALDAAKAEAAARGRARGLRGRHARHGEAAPACRCVLRQGDGQRRRPRPAGEPPQAARNFAMRRARSPISRRSRAEPTSPGWRGRFAPEAPTGWRDGRTRQRVRRRFAAEFVLGSRVAFRLRCMRPGKQWRDWREPLDSAFPEACNAAKRS